MIAICQEIKWDIYLNFMFQNFYFCILYEPIEFMFIKSIDSNESSDTQNQWFLEFVTQWVWQFSCLAFLIHLLLYVFIRIKNIGNISKGESWVFRQVIFLNCKTNHPGVKFCIFAAADYLEARIFVHMKSERWDASPGGILFHSFSLIFNVGGKQLLCPQTGIIT